MDLYDLTFHTCTKMNKEQFRNVQVLLPARSNQVDRRLQRAYSDSRRPNISRQARFPIQVEKKVEEPKITFSFQSPQKEKVSIEYTNLSVSPIRQIIRRPISSIRANPIPQPLYTSQQSMDALFPSQNPQQQKRNQKQVQFYKTLPKIVARSAWHAKKEIVNITCEIVQQRSGLILRADYQSILLKSYTTVSKYEL